MIPDYDGRAKALESLRAGSQSGELLPLRLLLSRCTVGQPISACHESDPPYNCRANQ
jgi:hypothetical protein